MNNQQNDKMTRNSHRRIIRRTDARTVCFPEVGNTMRYLAVLAFLPGPRRGMRFGTVTFDNTNHATPSLDSKLGCGSQLKLGRPFVSVDIEERK
jgi:hypothetical protein